MISGGIRLRTGHPAILRQVQRNIYWTVGCVSILHSQLCYKEDTLRQTTGASCLGIAISLTELPCLQKQILFSLTQPQGSWKVPVRERKKWMRQLPFPLRCAGGFKMQYLQLSKAEFQQRLLCIQHSCSKMLDWARMK